MSEPRISHLVARTLAYQLTHHRSNFRDASGTGDDRWSELPAPDIVDGTFNFLGNVVQVTNAPPRTIAIIKVLQAALNAAQQGEPDTKVLDKIKDASLELADQIQKATVASGKPLVGLLLLLLAGNCSIATDTSLDWNKLVDQVRVYATGGGPIPSYSSPLMLIS